MLITTENMPHVSTLKAVLSNPESFQEMLPTLETMLKIIPNNRITIEQFKELIMNGSVEIE